MGFFASLLGKNHWDKIDDSLNVELKKRVPFQDYYQLLGIPSVNNHKFQSLLDRIRSSNDIEEKIETFADLCYENASFFINYKVWGQDAQEKRLQDGAFLLHISKLLKPKYNLSDVELAIVFADAGKLLEAKKHAQLGLEAIENFVSHPDNTHQINRKLAWKLGYLKGRGERLNKILSPND